MVVTSLSDLYESRGCWPTADSVCWLAWMDDGCGQGREFTISICAGDPKKRGHGDGGIQEQEPQPVQAQQFHCSSTIFKQIHGYVIAHLSKT